MLFPYAANHSKLPFSSIYYLSLTVHQLLRHNLGGYNVPLRPRTHAFLDLREKNDHLLIELRIIALEDFRVECHSYEECGEAALHRDEEDVADLETEEEGDGHDNRCVATLAVIRWLSDFHVQEGDEGADVGDENRAHGQNGVNDIFVDQSIDAARAEHSPCVLFTSLDTFFHRESRDKQTFAAGTYAFPYNAI